MVYREDGVLDIVEGNYIDEVLVESGVLMEAWFVRHTEEEEGRADGGLCDFLQVHSGETVRCPHVYSWRQRRTAASASGNKIHVPWSRSAVEGGRIDE